MSDEELEAENKANSDVRYQLSAFGSFDVLHNCPTNAAMLFFAKNLWRFIPGAYVQYVRFAGKVLRR
jgi:ATP-dependent DNA helicase RecG